MQNEMQPVMSRIWTWIAETTLYNDNQYAMSISFIK